MKFRWTILYFVALALTVTVVWGWAAFAQAQEPRATIGVVWTQPDTTITGKPMADGWAHHYNIFIAAEGDTLYYGQVPAPLELAAPCVAYVSLKIGVPSAIQVEVVDKWDQIGPVRSFWSDVTIVIPDPPQRPGTPVVIE